MSEPTVVHEPNSEQAPATPAAPAEPHEGILGHIEGWWEQHARPDLEDLRGAVQELEQSNGLHGQNAANLAKFAQGILSLVKEIAPNATALPELETVVGEIARIAGEVATAM